MRSLQQKLLAIIALTTLGLVLGLYLPLRAGLLQSFHNLEQKFTERDAERARRALLAEVEVLEALAADYGMWDDTWRFMAGDNPGFVEANFIPEVITLNRLDLVAALSPDGEAVVNLAFERTSGDAQPPRALEPLAPLVRQAREEPAAAIVEVDGELLLAGASPIFDSRRQGEHRGTLILARWLDEAEVARLGERLEQALEIGRTDALSPEAAAALAGERALLARPLGPDRIAGYALLRSEGVEVVLRVEGPRELHDRGLAGARLLLLVIVLASVAFGIITLLAVEWVVVRRVQRLGAEVDAVAATADHRQRVRGEGSDEIGRLAQAINGMLGSLEGLATQLAEERAHSEHLLYNVLPEAVARRLRSREVVIADSHPDVSVLFADLVGFTSFSARVPPERLVGLLDELFARFDALVAGRKLEKIKTVGDAYMVAAGVPEARDDHAVALVELALDMQQALLAFNRAQRTSFSLRVGIHSGPVVAGVIGTSRLTYDLWGDTVNVASRMESTAPAGEVQVSEATRDRLGDAFELEPCEIAAKGKGTLRAWRVTGRAGAPAAAGQEPS